MERRWIFQSYNNAGDDGLNDAGIETFSGQAERANIREIIQNSLDQISSDAKKEGRPVIVEFDDFMINPNEFPGYQQYLEIIEKCLKRVNGRDADKRFLEQMKCTLQKDIRVLRMSDFNTTGLIGAEDGDCSKPWHNLVKAKGVSQKANNSGGSFGIGKSAPFACSLLRTVFYNSKVDGVESHIGVSRLMSHEDTNGITMGTGFFTNNKELLAIQNQFNIGDFKRNENGTDIFILGYNDGNYEKEIDYLKNMIIESVLVNFFVTIHKKKLVVKYKDIQLSHENIGHYISYLDDEKFLDLKLRYDLLVNTPSKDDPDKKIIVLNTNEYGEKFGFENGDCRLLLRKCDDASRKILITRESGMTLFEQTRISSLIQFTGLLMIEGEKMNAMFKEMETPAHNEFKPSRVKTNTKLYEDAYIDLKKYLKQKVNESFGITDENEFSAYDMNEFFELQTLSLEGNKYSSSGRKISLTAQKQKTSKRTRNNESWNDENNEIFEDPPKKNGKKAKSRSDSSSAESGKKPVLDIANKKINCNDLKKGEYTLSFKLVKQLKSIKLVFFILGEDGKFVLDIRDVEVTSNNATILKINKNNLYLSNIIPNEMIEIKFKIDYKFRCMLEVEYYENL